MSSFLAQAPANVAAAPALLSPELTHAFWISGCIAVPATLLAAALALPIAGWASRPRPRFRHVLRVVETAVLLPLVLPPTVVGYLLILLFGAHGLLGGPLASLAGYSIMFRLEGGILASAIVALPLIYLPTKAALRGVDRDLEDTARLFGYGETRLFLLISLPLARRGLISGLVLGFARALGEFGATVMVLGIQTDKMTLPQLIWSHYESGSLSEATPAVLVLVCLAFALILLYDRLSSELR